MKKTLLANLALLTALVLQGQQTPPSCVITFPHCNAYFMEGHDIPIRVYASDMGGTQAGGEVTKVEFFSDTVKLGESVTNSANTWSFLWTEVPAGTYRITARATDNDSVVFTSAGVIIEVGEEIPRAIGLSAGKGKYVGNIVQRNIRSDFNEYWNAVTSENDCKWGSVENVRDVMYWTLADRAYNHAKDHHFAFRYHVIVWGSQYPRWIETLEPAEFQEEVEEYMAAVAARYPLTDQVEVLNENMHIHTWNRQEHAAGTPYFREGLGGEGETGYDWAIWLFKKARHYFPNTKLVINDFELETNTAGRNEILDLVKVLRDSGLIDGFGTQAHYFNIDGISSGTLKGALDGMAKSGLPIYVTEMDLKGRILTEAGQMASYQNAFPEYWKHPAVAGITFWGYVEGSTWATGTGILNADGSERSAMTWLRSYLAGQPDVGYPFEGIPVVINPEVNLIRNGEFDYDTAEWDMLFFEDAGGSMEVVQDAALSGDHALKICPSVTPGSEPRNVQVMQDAPIEAGKHYEITFLAKSDAPRTLSMVMDDGPAIHFSSDDMLLDTVCRSYMCSFTAQATSLNNKLRFLVGNDSTCVYIDSVVCRVVDNTGILSDRVAPTVRVFPNPASWSIQISGLEAEKVRIYDTTGRLIMAIPDYENKRAIDISSLPEGIYILRAGDAGARFIKN